MYLCYSLFQLIAVHGFSLIPFHFHFTVSLFLHFAFLYCELVSSPFPSLPPPLSLFHFLLFLYYSYTSPVIPLYFSLVERDYIPPLNFSVTELFIVPISFLPWIFPLSISLHYYVAWSPSLLHGNLPWSSTGLQLLPPSCFFFFILLFITSSYTDFYSFVFCSSLLPTSSLICPCPSPSY
jgi:hypothetical protein